MNGISFILIGRNVEFNLEQALRSIHATIDINRLVNSEVVYVDSDSTDLSLAIAQRFARVRCLKISGETNASIARNVGARHARFDTLFFIDGDMRLNPEALQVVYSEDKGLSYPFVSFDWLNCYLGPNGDVHERSLYFNLTEDRLEGSCGGLFIIEKSLWDQVGGMRDSFKRSQDVDLALRLAQKGVRLLRKAIDGAEHYTVAYLDKRRRWNEISNELYGRSLLYRKNFWNPFMWRRMIRSDYTALSLLSLSIVFALSGKLVVFIPYFLLLLVRKGALSELYVYFLVRDVLVILGFFCFYPKSRYSYSVTVISTDEKASSDD